MVNEVIGAQRQEQSRVRIAFDARYVTDRYHGIGRHAFSLLEALTRLDPDRSYVAFYNRDYPNARFDWSSLNDRSNLRVLPIGFPLHSAREQVAWPWLLRSVRADLFHSPYVSLPLLAPQRLVMTVHDLILENYPEYVPDRRLARWHRIFMQLATTRAAAVLTVSETTRADLFRSYPRARDKTHVISNAVDGSFRPVLDQALLSHVRSRYGLPSRFVLSLGVGRPHKNISLVVRAIPMLPQSIDHRLVIGGEHDRRFPDDVGSTITELSLQDRVIRIGRVAEAHLAALYTLADAFVFPSLVEGFGMPPLEAMACGTPVLLSSHPALVEVAGEAGVTFDPTDPADLAAKLAVVLSDATRSRALRSAGLIRAASFTWDRVATRTIAAYDSVLVGPHPRNA